MYISAHLFSIMFKFFGHAYCISSPYFRCAEVLEIQLGSCSAKGVMVHTIVTANIRRTRLGVHCLFLSFISRLK